MNPPRPPLAETPHPFRSAAIELELPHGAFRINKAQLLLVGSVQYGAGEAAVRDVLGRGCRTCCDCLPARIVFIRENI